MENQANIIQSEIDLIKKAQNGSERAFNKIFYKYKPFVENLLYQYIKDMDEAKDITNIVFCKVYDKLPTFTEYNTFGGWLRILTKNTAIDYLRTIKPNHIRLDDEECTLQLKTDNMESDLINQITFDSVLSLLNKLPEEHRNILNMFYVGNNTVSGISKRTGVPTGTIKSILHRFRKRAFKQLNL